MGRCLWVGLTLLVAIMPFTTAHARACAPGDDVLAALRCIEGLTVEEVESKVGDGIRQFEMKYRQPLDHDHPEGETFEQRVTLLHLGWERPMVLQTSGYAIFYTWPTEIMKTFGTNQLQVEHRFFADSTPASKDLAKLNIRQSAADFHRIAVAFKELYQRPWVGTGASKGGMTSVFHRRFYSDDLEGTVADVAPLSFAKDDERYIGFVDNVGDETYRDCRIKLETLQKTLLTRRGELVPRLPGTYATLGGPSVAFEHAVIELPFAFWQYQDPQSPRVGCDHIPGTDAADDVLYAYLNAVNSPQQFADDALSNFFPYFFQAGTELGAPAAKLSHLDGMRHHEYSLDQYMPRERVWPYSPDAMRDIERWVKDEARGVMFVYGEHDPWSAGAFPSASNGDMHTFIVPAGNHGANFSKLAENEHAEALTILERWLAQAPLPAEQRGLNQPSLEDLEFNLRRGQRSR